MLGYAVAHYADFYELKHILVLGRVTTGDGGDILVERAPAKVLARGVPGAGRTSVTIALPDEKSRRVGQSIAAASLPAISRRRASHEAELRSQPREIYVPDGVAVRAALARTTHMAIAAHQDDLEIMALDGILAASARATSGSRASWSPTAPGSPRDGIYARYTDAEMRGVRRLEQKKAAFVGEYAGVAFLDYPVPP